MTELGTVMDSFEFKIKGFRRRSRTPRPQIGYAPKFIEHKAELDSEQLNIYSMFIGCMHHPVVLENLGAK